LQEISALAAQNKQEGKLMTQQRIAVTIDNAYLFQDSQAKLESPFIRLLNEQRQAMRIFVGQHEATGITLALQNVPLDRPQTFDTMLTCITAFGGTIEEVYINDFKDDTFYALTSLRIGEEARQIDMRPSDALNLALRAKCPIFVREDIFQRTREMKRPEETPAAPTEPAAASIMTDEKELARMYIEDQVDRKPAGNAGIDWSAVAPRDAARLARIKELYHGGAIQTGMDYYYAAMILQHSSETDDYLLAHELCVAAISRGVDQAKWLAAASEDRYLLSIGRPQRFGTQFRADGPDGAWQLCEMASGLVDALRLTFNVPPLSSAQAQADRMNAKTED